MIQNEPTDFAKARLMDAINYIEDMLINYSSDIIN